MSAGVFAGMFVLSAFVILIDMGVTLVERRLLCGPRRRWGGFERRRSALCYNRPVNCYSPSAS